MKPNIPPPNYTQVPNVILDRISELEGAELAIILVVCRETFGWHREKRVLSLNDFAKATGYTRRAMTTAVAKLIEIGWLQRSQDGSGFAYEIAVELGKSLHQTREVTSPELGKSLHQPDPSLLVVKKGKETLKESADAHDELPERLDDESFRKAWREWQQHRKEKRQTLTPTARSRQLSKLAEMGAARAIAAIQHSIANGWTGIFEPKGGLAAKKALPTANEWEDSRKRAEDLFGER